MKSILKNNLRRFIGAGLYVISALLLTAIITDRLTDGAIRNTLIDDAVFSSSVSLIRDKKLPIYCVKTDKKQIALTFDGAWGNEDTATLLDILDRQEIKATFFFTGGWISNFPEDVKTILKRGMKSAITAKITNRCHSFPRSNANRKFRKSMIKSKNSPALK